MGHKISIIGSAGLPASYGGFETLVEHIVINAPKNESDLSIFVYCSGIGKDKNYNGATLKYININAHGFRSIFYDIFSMISAGLNKSDSLLLLGLSGSIFIPFYKLFFHGKIITNVDGIEWKRQKFSWFTSKFLKFSEYLAVKFSNEIISDNKAVGEHIYSEYGRKSHMIPYGGDHIDLSISSQSQIFLDLNISSFFLGICRIEPENNIELILEAFSKVPSRGLVFIGNWDNSDYGKLMRNKYSTFKNIHLIDPIYEQKELNIFRKNCSGYVHGHSAGGTNPSLVEAMYFSDYIACYDCNFNRNTTDNNADYFSDSSELVEIIKKPINKSHKQSLLHKTALQRYNWSLVSKAYFELLGP